MWVIRFKDSSITDTASESEQGSWNLLHKAVPATIRKSIRELQDLGYAARKTKKKEKKK